MRSSAIEQAYGIGRDRHASPTLRQATTSRKISSLITRRLGAYRVNADVIQLPQLEIRRGTSADATAVTGLVESVWMEIYAPQVSSRPLPARGSRYFSDLVGDPGTNSWLAVRGCQCLGFGQITANCIDQLWVSARVRRRGIGTRLLGPMLEAMRNRGFAHAQIGCEDFNAPARAFLNSLGWQQIGAVEQSLGPGRFCQALVYSKALQR